MKVERKLLRGIIIFVISYLIVGYMYNNFISTIDWIDGRSFTQVLYQYYVVSLPANFIPSGMLALVAFIIVEHFVQKRKHIWS